MKNAEVSWLLKNATPLLSMDDFEMVCAMMVVRAPFANFDYVVDNFTGGLKMKMLGLLQLAQRRGQLELLIDIICQVSGNFAVAWEAYQNES